MFSKCFIKCYYHLSVNRKNVLPISCLKLGLAKMSSGGASLPLESIINFLETFAPKKLAEGWDNTGLLIEPYSSKSVKNILLTNDLTEEVVKEAIKNKSELIISYHPPVFHPLKTVTSSTRIGRIVGACLENKIAVYSPHTCWDSVCNGVNDWLASAFVCKEITPILPKDDNAGVGRFCILENEIKISQAIESVKELIAQANLQIALGKNMTLDSKIKTIAVCAGSGGSVLEKCNAELFVTGEMSHHSLLDAVYNKTSVIVCNHSNSERGFLKLFKKTLEQHFEKENLNVLVSKEDRDPLMFV